MTIQSEAQATELSVVNTNQIIVYIKVRANLRSSSFFPMASPLYVRHEKLRHEVNREITFLDCDKVDDDLRKKFVNAGFYYEKNWEMIICFSCGFYIEKFMIQYKPHEIDYYKVHKFYSPKCAFLNGDDLSIGKSKSFNQKCSQSTRKIEEQKNWLKNIPEFTLVYYLDAFDLNKNEDFQYEGKRTYREYFLPPQKDPIELPFIRSTNVLFNIERFFIVMRSEKRRYETYKFKCHEFPEGESMIRLLTLSGFFYTLQDTAVQCFACRLVLRNIKLSDEIGINDLHHKYCDWCPMHHRSKEVNISDLKLLDYENYLEETNNEEIQCSICKKYKVNLIINCGHPMCSFCETSITTCSFCRQKIKNKQKIFWQ